MKLLHIITTMNPESGGPSQVIRNINTLLYRFGIKSEVLSFDSNDFNRDISLKSINLGKGITSYQYHNKLKNWLIYNLPFYDFVSINGIWQYHNLAVYQAIKYLKKNKNLKIPKVIIMPHGMLAPYFQEAKERKIKALRNLLVWQLTEKKAINAADAIFFTCQEELNLAKLTFKDYAPKKTINVGFGIEHPPTYSEQMKFAFNLKCPDITNKKYWLFLSRIHPVKGIKELVKVYNLLKSESIEMPELVIAGPNDSIFAKEIKSLAFNNPSIHFTGMLTGDEKWGALYGCELFLLPSNHENFGVAIVEAMACKKPVLITKQVNIWREIEDGNCGWVIERTENKLIESKLVEILKKSSHEVKLKGDNAYNTYAEKFDVSTCAINFVNALKSL